LSKCYLPRLAAQQLETHGSLDLSGVTAHRQESGELAGWDEDEWCLDLEGARIGGKLILIGATLRDPNGRALNGDRLTVTQSMQCQGLQADGAVDLIGASIGGSLSFSGAKLGGSPEGYALAAHGITVGQSMSCDAGFQADGAVGLSGANINGRLGFDGAKLRGKGDKALLAYGLTVRQSMFCGNGFEADGGVRLSSAHIGETLAFDGAKLSGTKAGNKVSAALVAFGLTVDQNMLMSNVQTDGTVQLYDSQVNGTLTFDGSIVRGKGAQALAANGLTVSQNMFCANGMQTEGIVSLVGAKIGGTLEFSGARLRGTAGDSRIDDVLLAHGLTVGQNLICREGFQAEGAVNLHNARVGALYDSQASWPERLNLEGLVYDELKSAPEVTVRQRLGWLQRDPRDYVPQPYEQLAAFYRSAGQPEQARTVLIAKQWRRRKTLHLPGKIWNWLLYLTVGYGYRPWLAGVWLAGLFGFTNWLLLRIQMAQLLDPTNENEAQQPAFHSVGYALDLLLPIVNLGQEDAWIPRGWAVYWTWGFILAGWVLTTAVVAGLSGIFKRD
jgi:hypothetical protein